MNFDVVGVQQSLNDLSEMLTASGTAIDGNFHKPLGFRTTENNALTVTWSSTEDVARPVSGLKTGSLAEYLWFLRNRQYSALLFDGSLLQMSYIFRRSSILVGHRLCYFPSPVPLSTDETGEYAVEDLLDMHLGGTNFDEETETSRFMLRPYIRFDFNSSEQGGNPQSHVHFAFEGCRVPVRTALSPLQFVQFVFQNFYPQHWESSNFGCCVDAHLTEVITAKDCQRLHFSWRAPVPITEA